MYKNLYCIAIIVAAGNGKRMNSNINKQFLNISYKPVIAHTIQVFENINEIDEIIVVTKNNLLDYLKIEIVDKYNFTKVKKIVPGSYERQYSVFEGIKNIDNTNSIVLVHDGVRPFVKKENIVDTIISAYEYGSGVLGVRVKDTIKMSNNNNIIQSTLERGNLWSIQTPQTFRYDIIYNAHSEAIKNNFLGTDDSILVEKINIDVKIIEGDYNNIKITTNEDIVLAEHIFESNLKIKSKKNIDIYTDGACSGNPGKGGYGIVMIHNGLRKEFSEGFKKTTNNRMEILAVIKALEFLKEPCNVNIYSDSKYVIDAITKGWAKKWKLNNWKRNKNEMASNIDLWERILNLLEIHNTNFIWVKGHANNIENERCDYLAKKAIECSNLQCDKGYKE